jgi:hypothetical protein
LVCSFFSIFFLYLHTNQHQENIDLIDNQDDILIEPSSVQNNTSKQYQENITDIADINIQKISNPIYKRKKGAPSKRIKDFQETRKSTRLKFKEITSTTINTTNTTNTAKVRRCSGCNGTGHDLRNCTK